MSDNIRFALPAAWSDYTGESTVLVGAKERKLMHDSAKLTASALSHSTLHIVENAAHDLPLTQPGVIAGTLIRHIGD